MTETTQVNEAADGKSQLTAELDEQDICGLCGMPGADKIPHPIHWPDEQVPDTELVHAECEAAECARASALCQGSARDEFLRGCR